MSERGTSSLNIHTLCIGWVGGIAEKEDAHLTLLCACTSFNKTLQSLLRLRLVLLLIKDCVPLLERIEVAGGGAGGGGDGTSEERLVDLFNQSSTVYMYSGLVVRSNTNNTFGTWQWEEWVRNGWKTGQG